MSAADKVMPLISGPWLNAEGNPLPVLPLPGLRSEVIQGLECTYPGKLSASMKELLGSCCGLTGTELGSIDFTGCWFLEEPSPVFRPALTLAVDDAGRRWIAEVGDGELPGPIWCVFPYPEVAVQVSHDLAAFLAVLREQSCRGSSRRWLEELAAQGRSVWSQRHTSAIRPHEARRADASIRGWLVTLPPDAYVYDLRTGSDPSGWPYGVAGPSGRHYRCGRLPVFAVAGLPAEGWRAPHPRGRIPPAKAPAIEEVSFAVETARVRRRPRIHQPVACHRRISSPKITKRGRRSPIHGSRIALLEVRPCA